MQTASLQRLIIRKVELKTFRPGFVITFQPGCSKCTVECFRNNALQMCHPLLCLEEITVQNFFAGTVAECNVSL